MGMPTYLGIEHVCWVNETFSKITDEMKIIIQKKNDFW